MKEHKHSWWLKKTKTDYNKYIRLLKSDSKGYGICVTCGTKVHYKNADAGHFVHGLNFVLDNQHIQCKRCNMYLSGNLIEYTLYMIKTYGIGRVEELRQEKNKLHKYTIPELKEMRAVFKQYIANLQAIKEGL